MICHLVPVKMPIIKRTRESVLAGMWRKGDPCALLVGVQIGTHTMENSMESRPQTETPVRSSNSTSGCRDAKGRQFTDSG